MMTLFAATPFRHLVPLIGLLLLHVRLSAQKDSIVLRNQDIIVGEIKTLERGVLTIKTPYSKSDFTVKWSGIREIYSDNHFLIRLRDGRSINGTIQHVKDNKQMFITNMEGYTLPVKLEDVIFVKGVRSDFWGRLKFNMDLGMTIAKANALRQFSTNSSVGYVADHWQSDAHYNFITASQENVARTKRTDAAVNVKYYLQKRWFTLASVNFLSNTEQALALRSSGRIGGGKMIFHTNKRYWGVGSGLSFNIERFTNSADQRRSLEAFTGSELNIFDAGDFNMLSSIYVFPSLTEKGRWRSDIKVSVKYDLPHDFYIKPGITVNYDNRPAITGRDWDYVFTFSIGWEL